jgi:hypothetical protein
MVKYNIFDIYKIIGGWQTLSIEEIGCCGAYCKTCKAFAQKTCLGCKLGYESGERDISKAKCLWKVLNR